MGRPNRVADLAIALDKLSNDCLARIDHTRLGKRWGLARHFVARIIADEIARRNHG